MNHPPVTSRADLAAGLRYLVEQQMRVNINRPDVGTGSPQSTGTYALAMIVEIAETLQELNWKPWKGQKPVNWQKTAEEVADILAFFGIFITDVIAQTGLTTDQLAAAYDTKTEENVRRAEGGVDGYVDARKT